MSLVDPERPTAEVPVTSIGRWVRHLEIGLIALIFFALVVLGLTQIGLRNLADSALPWADPAMRAGVLWLAMLSAALAAGEGRHIRIDLLGRLVPVPVRSLVDRAMFSITALFCIGMVHLSMETIRLEREFGDLAFLAVPRWLVLAIIPVGFALMGWRFMRRAVLGAPGDRAPDDRPESSG